MKLEINNLPSYTRKEEIFNVITHLVGLAFSIGIFIFFLINNIAQKRSFSYVFPYYFYALTMGIVFFISSAYHSSKFSSKTRGILRIIDHSDIYLFVFGTYLPLCLYGVTNTQIMITVLSLEGVFMLAGIILNVVPSDSNVLKVIAYIIYIIDGWLMVFFYPFGIGMDFNVFLFILIGGVIYSIGAIIYAIGKKAKYLHCIFHIFVVLGAVTQFIGIYLL